MAVHLSRRSDALRLPGFDMATVQTMNVLLCRGPVLYLVYKTEFQIQLMLHQSKAVEEEKKWRRAAQEPWQQCSHNSYDSASARDATQRKKERKKDLEEYICHTYSSS